MASGVFVEDECKCSFNDLKLKKDHKFLIYRISDDFKSIIIETKGAKDATYEDFTSHFSDTNCRYGIFDYHFVSGTGAKKEKIIMISWVPDTAAVKNKMLYAASKDALKKKLAEGIAKEFQASDKSDIAEECVLKEFLRSDRV